MKNTIYILTAILLLAGCKKHNTNDLNKFKSKISDPYDISSVLSDLGYGYDGLIHIATSTGNTAPGGICKATFFDANNNSVSVGNFKINNETITKNTTNNIYDIAELWKASGGSYNALSKIQSYFGQTLQFSWTGDSFGFGAFDTIAFMPTNINLTSYSTTGSRQLTTGQSIALTWTGGSTNDEYLFLEMYWVKKTTNKGPGMLQNYGVWIDDNGSYTIPSSIVSQFDTTGDIEVRLHRYRAYEFLVPTSKKVVIVGQTTRSCGPFYY
jgi:hypothetical protein